MSNLSPASDTVACAAILQRGSKSFALAGRILPHRLRAPAAAVYAFCREADDAVDNATDVGPALLGLQQRLDRIYAQRGLEGPVDRALAAVVVQWQIPRTLFEALLEGFAWDAAGRTYDSLEELTAYAARVAGSVGAIMTLLMGQRDPLVLARACDLGVAMQLTNIARDVGDDARLGRLYLPRDWLREVGIDPEAWLQAPQFTPALGALVERLVGQATPLYRRAELGIPHLPGDCRMAINAARLIYADIGTRLAAQGCNSVARRTVVPTWRKFWLLARATLARFWRPRPDAHPCLPANLFLVSAAGDRGLS